MQQMSSNSFESAGLQEKSFVRQAVYCTSRVSPICCGWGEGKVV